MKEQEQDPFRMHLSKVLGMTDMAAIQGNLSNWFEALSCLYRDTFETLGEDTKRIQVKYRLVQISFFDYQAQNNRIKYKGSIRSNLLPLLQDFDMTLKGVLYNRGVLTKKTITDKKEKPSKVDAPKGFEEVKDE
ncbi:unnamed protein product [marine sediment metagenome]|uniref:Uncharacterized protein n=1 Tax=marine sediment metagenome TaxID=412755 RepID=X1E2X6_9ZZZZ